MTVSQASRPPRWPWVVAVLLLASDQWTKAWVVSAFTPGASRPLLPPLLQFTYVQNTGAAFGLLKGQQGLFLALSLGVIGWIGWELIRRRHPALVAWGCALVLGGASGNLIDRGRLGYVIDFIQLPLWPVFNVADSAITIGVILLILQSLRRAGHG